MPYAYISLAQLELLMHLISFKNKEISFHLASLHHLEYLGAFLNTSSRKHTSSYEYNLPEEDIS